MLDNKGFDLWADGYDKSVSFILKTPHLRNKCIKGFFI